MAEEIKLPKEHAQRVFDALVGSMDFGSDLDSEDVAALRALAIALGVDPLVGTPREFRSLHWHPFDGETDRERIAVAFGCLKQTRQISVTGAPYTVNSIDEARMPNYIPCKVGTYSRKCLKPESDPIHQAAS